jgi:hypothetical protein
MKQSRPSLRKRDGKYRGFKTGMLLGVLMGLILGTLGHAGTIRFPSRGETGAISDGAGAILMAAKNNKAPSSKNIKDGWKTINIFYGDTSLLTDRVNPKQTTKRSLGNLDFVSVPANLIEQANKEYDWSSQVLQGKVVYEMLLQEERELLH